MMSVMPFISAQIPANTSSVAARERKNSPSTQNARITIRIPAVSPSHQSGLYSRSTNAWI